VYYFFGDTVINTTRTIYLEDVFHVVCERIDGVVGEDKPVFDQIEFLHIQHVVNEFLLETFERHENTRRLWRPRGGRPDDDLGVSAGGLRGVQRDAGCGRCRRTKLG